MRHEARRFARGAKKPKRAAAQKQYVICARSRDYARCLRQQEEESARGGAEGGMRAVRARSGSDVLAVDFSSVMHNGI